MKSTNDSGNRFFTNLDTLSHEAVVAFMPPVFAEPSAEEPVIRLGFRAASLDEVLNYLRLTAGFIIRVGPSVNVRETVEVYDDQPLTREGAFQVLKVALSEKGCTAIQDGRVISIIRNQDTKKSYIPIPFPTASEMLQPAGRS